MTSTPSNNTPTQKPQQNQQSQQNRTSNPAQDEQAKKSSTEGKSDSCGTSSSKM